MKQTEFWLHIFISIDFMITYTQLKCNPKVCHHNNTITTLQNKIIHIHILYSVVFESCFDPGSSGTQQSPGTHV